METTISFFQPLSKRVSMNESVSSIDMNDDHQKIDESASSLRLSDDDSIKMDSLIIGESDKNIKLEDAFNF